MVVRKWYWCEMQKQKGNQSENTWSNPSFLIVKTCSHTQRVKETSSSPDWCMKTNWMKFVLALFSWVLIWITYKILPQFPFYGRLNTNPYSTRFCSGVLIDTTSWFGANISIRHRCCTVSPPLLTDKHFISVDVRFLVDIQLCLYEHIWKAECSSVVVRPVCWM